MKPEVRNRNSCQTAHCGRYIPYFDFGAKPSPIVPYRHLPQTLSGMTADCRSQDVVRKPFSFSASLAYVSGEAQLWIRTCGYQTW